MDLSGNFVAFFGQKNRIPVRKSNLIITMFRNYYALTMLQLLYIIGTILNKIIV